jgi:hypothetical protein
MVEVTFVLNFSTKIEEVNALISIKMKETNNLTLIWHAKRGGQFGQHK